MPSGDTVSAMTPTCIYCLNAKPLGDFDTEHVIPQSFGTFEPDNLTLEQTVCRDCNNRMGRRLEEFLGRDSYEGILGYKVKDWKEGPGFPEGVLPVPVEALMLESSNPVVLGVDASKIPPSRPIGAAITQGDAASVF